MLGESEVDGRMRTFPLSVTSHQRASAVAKTPVFRTPAGCDTPSPASLEREGAENSVAKTTPAIWSCGRDLRPLMLIGYARVSTGDQRLDLHRPTRCNAPVASECSRTKSVAVADRGRAWMAPSLMFDQVTPSSFGSSIAWVDPHRPLAHLRRELVRRLAHDGPFLSGVGASGKPGAVH